MTVGDIQKIIFSSPYSPATSSLATSTNLQPQPTTSNHILCDPLSDTISLLNVPHDPLGIESKFAHLASFVPEVSSHFDERLLHTRSFKEACGIPLLGIFAAGLAEQLTQKIGMNDFKIDMEFPVIKDKVKRGTKPAVGLYS